MTLQDMPIRRKLMTIILLISGVVSVLTCGAFFAYDFLTFRESLLAGFTLRGRMIAANSTAALAFENVDDATEVLSALAADPHVTAAGLYDRHGRLFARYPAGLADAALPPRPNGTGFHFDRSHLVVLTPVAQGDQPLGTLYLESDLQAINERFARYGLIVVLVMAVSFAVAYLLSRLLEKQVSQPIRALADTARAVAARRDYSVRAPRHGADELGLLTDAFNQMLEEIQALHADLERRVGERTAELAEANKELQRRRAELQSLFESLPGLYLILTPDHRIVTASDAYLQATLTRREDIIGRGLFEVFPDNPGDPAADGVRNLRASLERVAAQRASDTMAIQKYDVRRPDGTWEERFWSPVNSPLLDADQRLLYLIHRVEDVTEFVRRKARDAAGGENLRVRLEQMEAESFRNSQQVQAANRQLEAANAELEAFSYSVSHDLRAPLRHVQGYIQMLNREVQGQLGDKARRYLQTIGDAAREMGMLIDDLLAFSRMGRTELRETEVDLVRLAGEVRSALAESTTGREITWRFAALPRVRGDASMLRQALANLLGNAVKYSRNCAAAEIELGCDGEEDGRRVFFVRDNGAGFDMRYAHKLFGVFQRLHRADQFEGTGIGLAIVRRIVTRHGGRTWAEGQPGAGATFYFTLTPVPNDAP
ncbi:MAG TPA: ATP-binding protein [Lacunisphaera sp.]|jgi:signal transduction histidine kinase|nr:ATP-binding protein [Lacunisphaera sp.]